MLTNVILGKRSERNNVGKLELGDGTPAFEDITYLEARIGEESAELLRNLSTFFPNLRDLTLSNSPISSTSHISQFPDLSTLVLENCHLKDIEDVSVIAPQIECLILSHNDITDISPLIGLDSLTLLDLSYNAIDSDNAVQIISSCSNLKTLSMAENPIIYRVRDFKDMILSYSPDLQFVDGDCPESANFMRKKAPELYVPPPSASPRERYKECKAPSVNMASLSFFDKIKPGEIEERPSCRIDSATGQERPSTRRGQSRPNTARSGQEPEEKQPVQQRRGSAKAGAIPKLPKIPNLRCK